VVNAATGAPLGNYESCRTPFNVKRRAWQKRRCLLDHIAQTKVIDVELGDDRDYERGETD
jgi:hypothetical protein